MKEDELQQCKRLVCLMLNSIEDNLKAIQQMGMMKGINTDVSKVQQDIIDIYEHIENLKPNDDDISC